MNAWMNNTFLRWYAPQFKNRCIKQSRIFLATYSLIKPNTELILKSVILGGKGEVSICPHIVLCWFPWATLLSVLDVLIILFWQGSAQPSKISSLPLCLSICLTVLRGIGWSLIPTRTDSLLGNKHPWHSFSFIPADLQGLPKRLW